MEASLKTKGNTDSFTVIADMPNGKAQPKIPLLNANIPCRNYTFDRLNLKTEISQYLNESNGLVTYIGQAGLPKGTKTNSKDPKTFYIFGASATTTGVTLNFRGYVDTKSGVVRFLELVENSIKKIPSIVIRLGNNGAANTTTFPSGTFTWPTC